MDAVVFFNFNKTINCLIPLILNLSKVKLKLLFPYAAFVNQDYVANYFSDSYYYVFGFGSAT